MFSLLESVADPSGDICRSRQGQVTALGIKGLEVAEGTSIIWEDRDREMGLQLYGVRMGLRLQSVVLQFV